MNQPQCSVIVLTMGDRPDELANLIASVPIDGHEGVLVGNGFQPATYAGWTTLSYGQNLGISGGRAAGAENSSGHILVFLDDDALNLTDGLLDQIAQAFAADAALGAVALRVVVEGTDRSLSEWQPRVRGRGELQAGQVTSFHGAAHAVRARAYNQVGGYHPDFFYAHEETDLAWRLLDGGWNIEYRPDLKLSHPFAKPRRHRNALWYSARNRVWLARRHLSVPVGAAYLALWGVIQLARCRSVGEVKHVLGGTREGMRTAANPRSPLQLRTMLRMTRLGRPPII